MTRTAIKLGVFTAVCVLFTGWLAFTIGNVQLFSDRYSLSATFDDVNGLLVNDNVKVAGVVVGKVSSIEIERGRARVTFDIDSDTRLPSDSAAAVRWRNLLGQRYVYLYPGVASTTLSAGDTVDRTESVVDLGELFNRLGPIVAAIDPAQVNEFLDTMVAALDGNQDSLARTIDDLGTLVSGLATRDEAIVRLVDNISVVADTITTRDAQIRTVLDNLVELASTFSDNTAVVDAAVDDLGEVSHHLHSLLSRSRRELDGTIANLVVVLAEVRPRLDLVDRALGNLDDASAAVFRAGRYGEFLNQVILCAGVDPWDGRSEPPCEGGASGLDGIEGSGSAPSAGAPATVSATPRATSGADAVRDLIGGGLR
jgi:phospholipid/cholesterol/gamma-HCH transport system substrate-binding protein